MRVTIVTGAGSGIGAAAAKLMASRGHAVVLVGRRAEALEEVSGTIAAVGGQALCVPADLADPSTPVSIVEQAVTRFGGVTGLVNNAATIKTMPLADYPLPVLDEHWAVNIRAPFLLIQASLPWLIASKGAVVNISSSSGTIVRSGQSLYGMTKAALEYLTRSLAGEFAKQGVRVNAIAYGPVDTPIHKTWASDLEAAYAWLRDQVPLGRIGTAEEAAWFIGLLLSDETSWLTGVVLPVDGGQALDIL